MYNTPLKRDPNYDYFFAGVLVIISEAVSSGKVRFSGCQSGI